MPVATQAAIKGLTPQQVEGLGITLILNNTYHLNLRPGIKVLQEAGGAHRLQGWNHNLLTVRGIFLRSECISSGIQDSGGFQLVSLNKFTKIDEEGALFASPFTGDPTMLTVCVFRIYGIYSDFAYSPRRVYQYSMPLVPTLSCSLTTSVSVLVFTHWLWGRDPADFRSIELDGGPKSWRGDAAIYPMARSVHRIS